MSNRSVRRELVPAMIAFLLLSGARNAGADDTPTANAQDERPPPGAAARSKAGKGSDSGNVCENETLREVFSIIHDACTDLECDADKLNQIDKKIPRGKLLTAMRKLFTVHIFFPSGQTSMKSAMDLAYTKADQLQILKEEISKPGDTTVYVVGRGSVTGSDRLNMDLSRQRTVNVYKYLLGDLKLNCEYVQKVGLGKNVLQLTKSDAKLLEIDEADYRSDPLILNQSVEIFVYPCRDIPKPVH